MENTNAVEPTVEKAPEVTSPSQNEDLTAKLASLEAENAKLAEEKENYRKGMLKYKKQEEPEPLVDESIDELVERKVQEKLYDTRSQEIEKQKAETLEKILKENEELRKAASLRSPSSPSSMGSNQDKPEVTTSAHWTPEQEASLKARGLDPEEVWKNLTQGGQSSNFTPTPNSD